MTIKEFTEKYLGKKVDWDGAYGGQCVDLFRQYVNDVLSLKQPKGVVGAKDFWTNYETDPILKDNFTKIPNTPTGVPQEGDVMIWDAWSSNKYGHIAIYIKGDVNKFISLDQNYPTLNKVTETEHNYTNPKVLGWLRPMTELNKCEVFVSELKIKLAELQTKYDKDIKTYNKKVNDLNSEINKLREVVSTCKDDNKDMEEDLQKTIETLRHEVSIKQTELNDLAKLNEALLEETKLWNSIKNTVSSFFKK